MKHFLVSFLVLNFCGMALGAGESREAKRLEAAAEIINEIMGTPEKAIPHDLLNKAVCVGIIPSEKKLALGIGGTFGKGAIVCRRGGDGPWGGPSMFTIGGPNIGFQLGGQATDFVLVVMNSGGVKKLLTSKTKLGADASAAAGPVGRAAEGSTDALLHAEILTYSRARGLFAGVSLDGQVIKQDGDGNARLYGRKLDVKDIVLKGAAGVPGAARPLIAALTKYSPHGGEKFVDK